MRINILFISIYLLMSFLPLSTLKVYYGLPEKLIEEGDLIIINLPKNESGRFLNSDLFNNVNLYLKENNQVEFDIKIHYAMGDSKFNKTYSKYLCKDLRTLFLKEQIKNIKCEGCGSDSPLVSSDNLAEKKSFNTRIEISR